MKLLKCEVCGSAELTKKDGLFVCDYCGAKYSLEEVKSMFSSGKIEVSGSVQIDNTSKLRSLVKSALDVCESYNFIAAKDYASQALDIFPNNYDALLIMSVYSSIYDRSRYREFCDRAKKNTSESMGIVT